MSAKPILYPMLAMVVLTVIVAVVLYRRRVNEMRSRRIHPQKVATSAQMAGAIEDSRAADNFRNLFEVPVLFYVWCIAIALTGGSSPGLVMGAWTYVGLRALHSLIQVTYNRVVHRFLAYVASTLLLFGLWAVLVVRLAA